MEQKNTDMGKAFRVALSIIMPKEDSEKNEDSEENEKHGYNDLDLYPALSSNDLLKVSKIMLTILRRTEARIPKTKAP
jgi:hypothetical protein